MKRKVIIFLVSGSLVANAILVLILVTPLSELLYRPLIIRELPRPGVAIVILSAVDVFDTNEGFPDFSTFSRLHKGVELYRAGYAPMIICVGGQKLSSSGKSFARVMKDTLVLYGIPGEKIGIQDEISGNYNYYQNLLKLPERFKIDLNKVLIVTAPQNTFRIKKIFHRMGVSPAVISSSDYMLHPGNWHQRFEFFRDVINEYWAIALFFVLDRI